MEFDEPEEYVEVKGNKIEPIIEPMVIYLTGRYYATLSVLPYMVLVVVFFFVICMLLLSILFNDWNVVFDILLFPFVTGIAMMLPFLCIFIFIIRWHGKRRIEMDHAGITMVLPNEKSVFIPWDYLIAVELRFNKPRLVQCTLVAPAMRFSFSNLEFNLVQRQALYAVFRNGFSVLKLRSFLYYLHRMAPHLSWRMSDSFKERYNMKHPPYDLDKMIDLEEDDHAKSGR